MSLKPLPNTLFALICTGVLLMRSPANAQFTPPKNNPLSRPAPLKDIKPVTNTNWEIISAERVPASSERVKFREQLTYRVTLRKNSARSKPVRIKVYPTRRDPNWKGWVDGTKFNIDTARAGETVQQDVLVRYSGRYALPPTSYGFQIVLENPDGTALNDHDKSDNTKKIRLLAEKKPEPKKKAKKKPKAKSSGVVRRSGVAGKTADNAFEFKAPRTKLLLQTMKRVRDPEQLHASCLIRATFNQLGGVRPEQSLESMTWCRLSDNKFVESNQSKINAAKADFAIFGIRACSRDAPISTKLFGSSYYKDANEGFEFWYKEVSGNKLSDNHLRRQLQWKDGGGCDWQPWQYCPKDATGQRMVAVGYQAHIKNSDDTSFGSTGNLHGIRLICRPLADVWID